MSDAPLPEGRYAEIGEGLRVHYHEAGEGHPVLFFHGSGPGASGWSNFQGNYLELAKAGFRSLVPDALGYGYSSKPEDARYTVAYLVDAALRFADSVGAERFAVVGNSMGGAMAIQLALDHPERVSHLVLMAPGGLESRETYMEMPGIKTMIKVLYGPEGITREGMAELFALQLYDASQITDAIIDQRTSIARKQPRVVFETLRVPPLADRLEELSCPVLALWGVDDKFCPVSGASTIASRCLNARVRTLAECGHWVMVEHRELFNQACIDFLKEA